MRVAVFAGLLGLVSGASSFLWTDEASACGGCFTGQTESTQVTGHRMALSVSPTQTTLWDQITYDGDPSEFAWVLPIAGQVDIGLSSDLLFEVLESETDVAISSPSINCGPTGCPNEGAFGNARASASGSASSGGGVNVIAQEVVGPYETVQLEATDPDALTTWLETHGYNLPADVEPVVSAYVQEGFGFLAVRLVPGQGINAMKPIRITSPGASATLPLRMVAAGTGARTPITLWIVGEGRYEPQNFGFEMVALEQLVLEWDTQSSNYAAVRQEILDADGASRWVIEAAEPKGAWAFDQIVSRAEYDPVGSGYADPMGEGAVEAAQADIDTLMTDIAEESMWITRISADLSRPALSSNLVLQASATQEAVQRTFFVQNTVGTKPACPPAPVCEESDFNFADPNVWDASGQRSDGCGLGRGGSERSAWLTAGLLAAVVLLARRRRA